MTETSTLVTTTTRSSQRPQPAPESQRWPTRRRWPKGRADESGLTTLEWLLIVAAVAGLAALAVVLVQNVVSDTSEQIAGSSARRVAAELHAADINDEARAIVTGCGWRHRRHRHRRRQDRPCRGVEFHIQEKMSTTEDHLRGCS